MFVGDADKSSLRQGDILRAVPFPLFKQEKLSFLGLVPDGTELHPPHLAPLRTEIRGDGWLTCMVPVRLCYAAVVSQCCDLELRNGKILVPTIALARLITVPSTITDNSEKLASLRANKDPRQQDPGYIKLFHIPAQPHLGGAEWVVDYNQIFPLPASDAAALLQRKVLQMTDEARIRFKVKLAYCLSRLTDDELRLGHPWLDSAQIR